MCKIQLTTPLAIEDIQHLKAGDQVFITGELYAAHEAAHKRMVEGLEAGEALPVDFTDQLVYYVEPCPPKFGESIGSAGPTTSYPLDAYAPALMEKGLRGMLGKGNRSEFVINSMIVNRCVYFGCVGGAGALLQDCIKAVEVLAYKDLGNEALQKFWVVDFPAFVVIDANGNNLYETERQKYINRYTD